jgi:hypothetical protein
MGSHLDSAVGGDRCGREGCGNVGDRVNKPDLKKPTGADFGLKLSEAWIEGCKMQSTSEYRRTQRRG